MIKAGILGTDTYIETYIDLLMQVNSFQLVGLYDINDEKALDIAKKFNIRIFTHPDELFDETDAVITTSGFNTYQCLKTALRKSKHVFIEKPAEYSISQIRELINLSDEAGVVVQMGFRHRYNPSFLAARPFISPQVRMIQTRRLLPFKENCPLHPVQDIMLHDVDNILSVVNSSIRKISAYGISTTDQKPDAVNALIEFHNGCIANLTANAIAGMETQDAVFFNPNDYIEIDFLNHKATRYSKRSENNMTLFGENKSDLNCEYIPVKHANEMADELEAFSRSILKMRNPEVNLENTSRTMAVIREINSRLKLTVNCL